MWRYRYALVCVLGALMAANALMSSTAAAADPSTQPRIAFTDLTYLGAFRLPAQSINGDSFSQGGQPMAYNPGRNSLFVGSRSHRVAEVTIPAPVNSTNVSALPFAAYLQGFADPTEGNFWQISNDGVSFNGLMVVGDKLYGAGTIYYDADNLQRTSHFSRSTNLSQASFVGMKTVWDSQKVGFVSGFMNNVPTEWQPLLGGPAITGQCCLPIMWRTSQGPSAFAWNPANLGVANPIPATPLLHYPYDHATLGRWDQNNPTYGASTEINGVAVLAGTRTALYIGRNGTGVFCYGNGTSDTSLVGTIGPDNEKYCYDPTNPSKGQHGWPYNYQIWAYDLNDLVAVKNGTKQPWDVVPYGVWPFSLPFNEPTVRIGGIGYDASRQLLYVSQLLADKDNYEYRPLIHVLHVGGGAAGAPLPAADTTPLPPLPTTTSTKVTAVALASDRPAPQAPGTTINFTATPTAGITPYQYKWLVYNGVSWGAVTGWTSSNTYAWTPTTADSSFARYRVGVWVKSSGNSADAEEASTSVEYAISGTATSSPAPTTTTSSSKATGVALSSNLASPQAPGTSITFTATPVGGVTPYQYKWLVYDNVKWNVAVTWTTSNSFTWTPSTANNGYRVGVWVRSAGNTADVEEVSTSVPYVISGTAAPAPSSSTTPSSSTSSTTTAVSVTANLAAPQPLGTTVTFTATPTGGVAPHQYKWLVYDGIGWTPVTSWVSSNQYAWTPTGANANYRMGVWVRSAGNTADALETSNWISFPIGSATSTSSPSPAPSTTSTSRATSVALAASQPAPQAPGTTITFTATPVGGVSPYQYKWLVYDGISWKAVISWTTSNTFNWTPGNENPDYRVGVWVRSNGNLVDAEETSTSLSFPISGAAVTATPSTPITTNVGAATVTLTGDKPSPQATGTSITFTAVGSSGTAPYSYKWYVWDGSTWLVVRGWSTTNSYTWTPTAPNPSYKVAVWIRSTGNAADAAESQAQLAYSITSGTTTTTTTTTTATVSSVVVGANKIAPQAAGTTITFTAVATGGTGPLQYKWLVFDGYSWVAMGSWTTTNTFNWTPATRRSDYRVGVWVKSAGNTADALEASNSIAFPIQ